MTQYGLRRYANIVFAFFLLTNLFAVIPTPIAAQEHETYLTRVKPVLQSRCYACHGALKQEANLRLDTVASMLTGGQSGTAIHAGDADASLLVQRITAHEESIRMPPEGEPLQPSQIETIQSWLNNGADHPTDEVPERDPKDHWSFRSPIRQPVPLVDELAAKNPIDAFLNEQLRDKGLIPQPIAAPQIRLRRVYLDLIGLPPTKMQLDAFVADPSEDSLQRTVEQLLHSPQYGERWGRHWMDIWRYSDWWGLGQEVRNSQKHMWHWRDWIVESLNADTGYDQMLQDMLAVDELHPSDLNRLRASGFLARQYFKFNRTSWLDETVEHTSKATLGLTFNCCKCHDHKYDPISQQDYYRLRAVFEPYQIRTEMVAGVIDFEKDGIPRAFDCNLEQETFVHIRGDDRNPDKSLSMKPSVPEVLQWEPFRIQPVSLPREAYEPAFREYVLDSYRNDIHAKVLAAREALLEAQSQLARTQLAQSQLAESQPAEKAATAVELAAQGVMIAEKSLRRWEMDLAAVPLRFAADQAKRIEDAPDDRNRIVALASEAEKKVKIAKADEELSRAELALSKSTEKTKEANEKKLAAAKAAFDLAEKQNDAPGESYVSMRGAEKAAESNLENEESRRKPFPSTSSGRRTAFAKWVIDRRNPLTARVAINHIWTRHFGRPLVATVFDFGRKGSTPSNQKLLDWLAVELMDHQWSMKHIHRLIVTSEAYQRTSSNAGADSNLAIDADNLNFWRMNSNRMESQLVRDSLLSLAGELDLAIGGPAIPAADEKSMRRSLYFVHSHNEHNKLLSAFDDANVLDCYRRGDSIVPQQALALENSKLAMEMVERIAQRLHEPNPTASDREFARIAFISILGDEPTPAELNWIDESIVKMRAIEKDPHSEQATKLARLGVVRAIVNHNDFITIR